MDFRLRKVNGKSKGEFGGKQRTPQNPRQPDSRGKGAATEIRKHQFQISRRNPQAIGAEMTDKVDVTIEFTNEDCFIRVGSDRVAQRVNGEWVQLHPGKAWTENGHEQIVVEYKGNRIQ
jgi:hypothetical protein